VRDFVRGTIRLNGWADAWAPVFREIETLEGPEGDARLARWRPSFWADNAYAEGEPDRVVLFVSLKAERDGVAVFHRTWAMDAWGDARGTAMGRLVSVPVSLAVEAVLSREIPAGVHAAPHDPAGGPLAGRSGATGRGRADMLGRRAGRGRQAQPNEPDRAAGEPLRRLCRRPGKAGKRLRVTA
jgi:hypothetical protein